MSLTRNGVAFTCAAVLGITKGAKFMTDLLFIGLTIGFFVLMLVFIWACEKV